MSKARWYIFVSAFRKLSKGRTEVFQACDSWCMLGIFCARIILAFILRVELFNNVVDGENLLESGLGRVRDGGNRRDMASRWSEVVSSILIHCFLSSKDLVIYFNIFNRDMTWKLVLVMSIHQNYCNKRVFSNSKVKIFHGYIHTIIEVTSSTKKKRNITTVWQPVNKGIIWQVEFCALE